MARTLTVRMSAELIIEMLTKGNDVTEAVHRIKCVDGLDEGSVLVGSSYDVERVQVVLEFKSPQNGGDELVDVRFERSDAIST